MYDSFGDSIDGCHLELPQKEIGEGLTLPYEPACIAVMVNSREAKTQRSGSLLWHKRRMEMGHLNAGGLFPAF